MSREATFADLIEAGTLEIGDGYRAKLSELGGEGPIFLRAASVSDGGIAYEGNDRFRASGADGLALKLGRTGDTIITTKGASTGRTAFVGADAPEFVYSPHLSFWRSRDSRVLDPLFLRYWARCSEADQQIRAMSGSTDMSLYLSLVDQRRLKITLPPIDTQRRVGALLGALDAKIELNRRMNETLERTIAVLFRRLVGRATERSTSIYDYAEVTYGAPFASARFNESARGLPLIRIRDLAGHDPEVFTDEDHPRATIIQPGDIVVGMDGEFRAHVWRGPRALLNQRVCSFTPRDAIPRAYVWKVIEEPLAFYEQAKTGTTVIHLGKRDIDRFEVVSPPVNALVEFGGITDPMLDRIVSNAAESRTLAALRDALLPTLISGELRIRDVKS